MVMGNLYFQGGFSDTMRQVIVGGWKVKGQIPVCVIGFRGSYILTAEDNSGGFWIWVGGIHIATFSH